MGAGTMDNADTLSVDAVWLQRYVGSAQFKYPVESSEIMSDWLATAARRGDMARIRHCLAAGADVMKAGGAINSTPLQLAWCHLSKEIVFYIGCVHDEIVRALTRSLGRTPTQMEIYGVATHKKTRRFRFHAHQRASTICTTFMAAVRSGDLKTVQSMVEEMHDIGANAVDKSTLETALSAAVANGQRNVAIYLLREGAHVLGLCEVNGEQSTVLLAAIGTGDVELVREIVQRNGVDVAQWYAPRCALVEALTKNVSVEMIELLLDLGVHSTLNPLNLPWPIHGVIGYVQGAYSHIRLSRERDLWVLLCASFWLQNKSLFEYLRSTYRELQELEVQPTNMAVLFTLAVYREDEDLVNELLQRNVPVNHNFGITAMVAAVAVNSTRMLRLLLDNGGDTRIIYEDIVADSPHVKSLLAAAVYANATDCVRMLLPLETRRYYREQAMRQAAKQGSIELVDLQMDDATMPSSQRMLELCLQFTTCPLMTDRLLTRWCPRKYPITTLSGLFARLCSDRRSDPELLSVYVSHGLDITWNPNGSTNETSPLMEGSLWSSVHRLPALPVVAFLLENGIPIVSVTNGKTPEQQMDEQSRHSGHPQFKQRLFRHCRDLFTAYSSP